MTSVEQFEASKIKGLTVVHPLAAVAFVVAAILLLVLPRKKAITPFILFMMLIPYTQVIPIASAQFFLYRILIIIGCVRIFIRSEINFGNKIDKIFTLMLLVHFVAYIALWQTGQSVIAVIGDTIDMLGAYIIIKALIRDFNGIERIIKVFIFIAIILAVCMINEQISGKNIFSLFGGPVEVMFREGRYRSQASLGHPILTGNLGALLLPLFSFMWLYKKVSGHVAMIGITSCIVMVYTSASSGPLISLVAALTGMLLFIVRNKMKFIRWGVSGVLVLLHLVMNGPVWALIHRFGIIGGSTSYHRYVLFDQFIRRFNEWWLFGAKSTNHWGWNGVDLWDVANGYVDIGINGGVFALILFFLLMIKSFRTVGEGIVFFCNEHGKIFLCWSVGTMLFVHLTAFMGVSYFGTFFILEILTLCMISILSDLSHTHSLQLL